MSNSKLVSCKMISPNKDSPRNHTIDTITIHCVVGQLTAEGLGAIFSKADKEASSNYGVDRDGRIGLYVEEKDRSWCTSSASNDNRAITIEVASDEQPPYKVNNKALNSLIRLCADICFRNKIKKLIWHGDKNMIGSVNLQNMTVHRWFSNKSCPGDYLFNKHSYIAKEVNKRLKVPYNEKDYMVTDYTPDAESSEYNYIDPMTLVDATKINPYIATLDRSLKTVDCNKLKKAGVVGVMIYGGAYYTTLHTMRTYYRADNLKDQVSVLDRHSMPYGMFVDVRARSRAEAILECRQLWYVVSKYPPQLGLWLRFQTGKSKVINNSILNVYYDEIVKWGLKDKCGLYIKKSELYTVISWDKYYNKFLLWLIDPVKSMAGVDDTVLTPEFFMAPEVKK